MPLCSRLTRLWFYIIYATAHRVKVSVLDQWWLSGRGFYCTCFFAFNEICQWQFDYLPPWKRKEQFEESLTFPLLSTITCSAFSISCISSVQSAPYVPHNYLWFSENFTMNLYSLSLMEMKCACVCMCICCVPESDLLWISLTGRWASRQSPVCIFNKAERMHGKNDVVSLVCISLFFWRERNQTKTETEKERDKGDTGLGHRHITSTVWCWFQNIAPSFQPRNHGAIMYCSTDKHAVFMYQFTTEP